MVNKTEGKQTLPRKLATRRKLLDAARDLFLEQGFAHVVVSEIPRRAGVSQGTFYNHFEDKVDIFLEWAEEVCNEVNDYIISAISEEPTELPNFLRQVIRGITEFVSDYPSHLSTIFVDVQTLRPRKVNDQRIPEVRWAHQWATLLVSAKGESREHTQSELQIGYVCVGIMMSTFMYAIHEGEHEGIDLADRTVGNLLRFLEPRHTDASRNGYGDEHCLKSGSSTIRRTDGQPASAALSDALFI